MGTRFKDSPMKRICIYCQTWESGGIEAFIYNILTHIDLSRFEIDVVVDVLKESVFTADLQKKDITFIQLSGSQRAFIGNLRRFARLMDEREYDVIHLNIFQALPLIYLQMAKSKGVPVRIAHSHNNMLRKSAARPLKMCFHRIASVLFSRCATDLWACSDVAARFMFPRAARKRMPYVFIPNGIDMERFRFDAKEREVMRKQLHVENSFVIGNIGRLCYQKNQDFLIDVLAQVKRIIPNAKLLLVGEGEMLTALQEKVDRLGVSADVIFYGTSRSVEKLLWAMDVFAFPSIFEGLGIVAIEAQAAGLIVICSSEVPSEVKINDTVRFISLADTQEWTRAVAKLPVQDRNAMNIRVSQSCYNISHSAAIVCTAYAQQMSIGEKK